jgi:peptidoglycan/LPS O-acetylase OafA/YrhL
MRFLNLKIFGTPYANTSFITGFKGFLALGIFLIHFSTFTNLSEDLSPPLKNLLSFQSTGVSAFFLISSFTIWISIRRKGRLDLKKYIISRIVRIIPVYFIFCLIAYAILILRDYGIISYPQNYYLVSQNLGNTISNILSHLTFTNLFDLRYRNTLLSVEWIIPLQMLMYALVPLVYFVCKTKLTRLSLVLSFSILITILSNWLVFLPYYYVNDNSIVLFWSLERYFFTFIFGIYLAEVAVRKLAKQTRNITGLILLAVYIIIMLTFESSSNTFLGVMIATIFSGLIILLGYSGNLTIKKIFENKALIFMGNISFSFYLIHFIVLSFLSIIIDSEILLFSAGLVISTFVSIASYFFLETFLGNRIQLLTNKFF